LPGFPLGTDQYGRDILSIMLHGAKYSLGTTIVVAFFRIILAMAAVLLLGRKISKEKPEAPVEYYL